MAAVILIGLLMRGSGILKYRLNQALDVEWTSAKRILNVGVPAGLERHPLLAGRLERLLEAGARYRHEHLRPALNRAGFDQCGEAGEGCR